MTLVQAHVRKRTWEKLKRAARAEGLKGADLVRRLLYKWEADQKREDEREARRAS